MAWLHILKLSAAISIGHIRLGIAVLLIFAPSIAGATQLSPSDVFRAASPSIVVIETFGDDGKTISQGSGVTVAIERVITNCHVIKGAASVSATYRKRNYPATLVAADHSRDVCALSVPELPAHPAMLGSSASIQVGDKAYAVGAPQGLDLTLSDGLISGVRELPQGRILQTTAPISPGSSGGGLFDGTGRLIGITTMYIKESQGLNFAVPVEWALALGGGEKPVTTVGLDEQQAKAQLVQFDKEMQANNPGYMSLRPELDTAVGAIRRNYPPSQWLARTTETYARLVSAQTSTDAAAAAADAAETTADSAAHEGISIRLLMANRAQTACKTVVLSDAKLANSVTSSTSTPLSTLCECAATDMVSKTSDDILWKVHLEEGPERSTFANALLQSLSSCVLMQDR